MFRLRVKSSSGEYCACAVQQCFFTPRLTSEWSCSPETAQNKAIPWPFHAPITRNGVTTISNSETLLVSVYAAPARELRSCAIGRLSRKSIAARSDSALTLVSCVSTCVGVRGAVSVMVAGSVRCVGCKHPGSFEVSCVLDQSIPSLPFCPCLIIDFHTVSVLLVLFSHLSVMDLKLTCAPFVNATINCSRALKFSTNAAL